MSVERVKEFFRNKGMESRVWEFDTSSATVAEAAETLGVIPARIAKTLSFAVGEGCALVVTAGDARIDNRKYKDFFGTKASMLPFDQVERFTGSAVGGVNPFALPAETPVYLDASLKRFATVFPACGSANSAIELTPDELFRFSGAKQWVDVCKDWAEGDDPAIDTVPHATITLPDDGEIALRFDASDDADETRGFVPMYRFSIIRLADGEKVGHIRLRLGYTRNSYYGGNIGYDVDEPYRGHGYAGKAVRLVMQAARAHRMPYVLITCAAANIASRKTIERLNGTLIETCVPPRYSGMRCAGEHGEINIYRFDLN